MREKRGIVYYRINFIDDLLILADEFRGRIIDLESEIYDLSYMSRVVGF